MDKVEQVQQRVTKVMRGLEHWPCEGRLRDLALFSRENGRLVGIGAVPPRSLCRTWASSSLVVCDGRVRDSGYRLK